MSKLLMKVLDGLSRSWLLRVFVKTIKVSWWGFKTGLANRLYISSNHELLGFFEPSLRHSECVCNEHSVRPRGLLLWGDGGSFPSPTAVIADPVGCSLTEPLLQPAFWMRVWITMAFVLLLLFPARAHPGPNSERLSSPGTHSMCH